MRDDPDRALELLARAKNESAAGLAELRDLVRGIRPPLLADRGLVDALRALAEDTSITTTVTSNLTCRLAPPLETALYFATAEVLTNTAEHARATEARILITETDDHITLTVTDDGRGGADPGSDHGGLAGIRRRLHTFDATLDISSPRGGPTAVTITAPKTPATPTPETTPSAP